MRTELTDVGEIVDDDAFRYEAPPGFRVLVDPNPFAEAEVTGGAAAWHLARGMTKMSIDVAKWFIRGSGSG
jgi:hypothetical protein